MVDIPKLMNKSKLKSLSFASTISTSSSAFLSNIKSFNINDKYEKFHDDEEDDTRPKQTPLISSNKSVLLETTVSKKRPRQESKIEEDEKENSSISIENRKIDEILSNKSKKLKEIIENDHEFNKDTQPLLNNSPSTSKKSFTNSNNDYKAASTSFKEPEYNQKK
jgi:hypothetical protein